MINFSKITSINVMLGGVKPRYFNKKELWCGVDGGARYLIENGVEPLISCGDFDSVDNDEKKYIHSNSVMFFEKNNQYDTDFGFSLKKIFELCKSIKTIDVYGATGGRLDHFFANIFLLNNKTYKHRGIDIRIIDDNNIIKVYEPENILLKSKKNYKYISILPIYDNTFVTITGAKYNVENLKLSLEAPNATSNEFLNDRDILIKTNKNIIIIYSKD